MKYAVIIYFAISFLHINAQDIVYLDNGQEIKTKVTEITPDVIKYKIFEFQDGPLYSIEKLKVLSIKYENGRVEYFQETPTPGKTLTPGKTRDPVSVKPTKQIAQKSMDTTDESGNTPGSVIDAPSQREAPTSRQIEVTKNNNKGFSFGVIGGINAATGLYDHKSSPNPPVLSILPAPTLGMNAEFRLSNVLSFQGMMTYRGKGDKIDMQLWLDEIDPPQLGYEWTILYPEAEGYIRTYLGYLELSLMPVLHLSDGFRIGVGGYAAIGLHGKEKSNYTIEYYADGYLDKKEIVDESRSIEFTNLVSQQNTETARYFNRLDYGLTSFIGFGNASPLSYGVHFSYGRNTWEPNVDLFGSETPLTETYHATAMLSVTYWINK